MSKVKFKYPLNIEAKDNQTGLTGIISGGGELVNGCVRYHIQPRAKPTENTIPDQWEIDEHNVSVAGKHKAWVHKFQYRTGDRVKSKINGYTGFVHSRNISANGCEEYIVEGDFKDGKRVRVAMVKQEIEFIDSGINKQLENKKSSSGCISASRKDRG